MDNLALDNGLKKKEPVSVQQDLIIIVGGYGSGKSEVAVNLARSLSQSQELEVTIADLDIVNPYFRSREALEVLEPYNIKSIVPPGDKRHADLPIILPHIKGAIEGNKGKLILDVGGDDVGARVLSSLRDAIEVRDYEMLLVLNGNRPFTSNVEECKKIIEEIEFSSRLKFSGIISNTHMMEYTTAKTILDGVKLAEQVSQESNLPISFVSAEEHLISELVNEIDHPLLELHRLLLKPWERSK